MPARLTIEKIKQKIYEKHGDTVKLIEESYINIRTKCKFVDKDYGEWSASPYAVIKGHGHMKRGRVKSKKTCLEKFGVQYPNQSLEVKTKRNNTNLNRYGVISTLKNPETLAKIEETNVERYGVKNVLENKNIRGRADKTKLEKYGSIHPTQNVAVIEKTKQTNINRYGFNNPAKSEVIKDKIKNANLEKYGAKYLSQLPEIREKIKQTNLKRYGVDHPMKNLEIAIKCSKSQNKTVVLKHWNNNEEVVCQAGWEVKTVNYLNNNKINYNWQHKIFTMPDGRTYRPDCYLIDEDKWVEIKGYFRKDAKEKWDWFHSTYTNSELWDKDKLKSMKIL